MNLDRTTIPNKFMYVKKHLINNIQPSKVLINPNFVQTAQIKPHFNKQFLQNQTIHINPKILGFYQEKSKNEVLNKAIINTPTKLVRLPQQPKLPSKPKQKTEVTPVRRTSIHTTYKIIRQSGLKDQSLKSQSKKPHFKSRFAIDNRIVKKSLQLRKYMNIILKSTHNYVKCNSKLNKTKYRKSNKMLVCMNTNKGKMKKGQLLTIRGQKYKLDSNHRTLMLVSKPAEKPNFKTIYLGGITFKQKQPNVFVKVNTNSKQALWSLRKQKLIHTLTLKMRKSNMPCPLYRKFGKCKGKENGTCIRKHNPDQISLCPKFLQGACIDSKCPLSHKVSLEKMPTCKFFLEGLCSKDDCPYLHVKINPKADICKDFLEGFCKKGADCDKRHQYLCPDYEKNGTCIKKMCPYLHGNMDNEIKKNNIKSKKNLPVFISSEVNKESESKKVDAEKLVNVRYYNESCNNNKDNVNIKKECADYEVVNLVAEPNLFLISTEKRPTLGSLPSFIPFFDT